MDEVTMKEVIEQILGHKLKALIIGGVSDDDRAFTLLDGDAKNITWALAHLQQSMFKTLEKYNEATKRTTNKQKKGKA